MSAPTLDRPRVFEVDGLVVDRVAREAELDGRRLALTRRTFDLLVLLASDPERVFTRRQMYIAMYGTDISGTSRTLDTHCLRLRNALDGRFVLGVRGVGYRLQREVLL